jgi:hypothetical protein
MSGLHFQYYNENPKNLELFDKLKIPTYRIPMDRYIHKNFKPAIPNMLNFYNSVKAINAY